MSIDLTGLAAEGGGWQRQNACCKSVFILRHYTCSTRHKMFLPHTTPNSNRHVFVCMCCCRAASTLLRLRQEVEASSRPAELMLHAGDLAYAGGKPEIWDSFIEGLQPFAGSVPYMVGVGNWEVSVSVSVVVVCAGVAWQQQTACLLLWADMSRHASVCAFGAQRRQNSTWD